MMVQNGLTCAAGPFILNYQPEFESNNWQALVDDYGQSDKHRELINILQTIHDIYSVHNWPLQLRKLARKRNLEMPEILT